MNFIKRSTALLLLITLLVSTIFMPQVTFAKDVYKWTNVKEIQITAFKLNVRTGPSTAFPVIGSLSQNEVVDVVGTLGSWFVVHLDDNSVGCVASTWTRVHSYHEEPDPTPTPEPETPDNTSDLTAQEREMFELINAERKKNGLPEYKVDMETVRVARIKAKDMVDNNYFSHNSPVYGSPFDMLRDFDVTFSTAGENIAGNSTVQRAHDALMNSSGHRENILGDKFDSIGIGIVKDSRYGYIFVQMFIKK
ncbi:MAG: CAP domain-containing protein [Eubacteriales bacterium]